MKSLIPIVVRPVLLSIKNRWSHRNGAQSTVWRDFLAALICACVMVLLYIATSKLLTKLDQLSEYVYLPSQYVLCFLLMALFFMLVVSNIVISSGAFFMSYDLELLRKAPLRETQFFFGRFLYTGLLSSWMPFLFLFPCLVAFVLFFKASLSLYLVTSVLLLPYFIIASCISYMLLLIVFYITTPSRRVYLFWVLGLAFLSLIGAFLRVVSSAEIDMQSAEDFARIVTILALPDYYWLPSYWVGTTLGPVLENKTFDSFASLRLLYSSAVALCSATYMLHFFLYEKALAHAQGKLGKERQRRATQNALVRYVRNRTPVAFAVCRREWISVKRDLSFVVQAIMLFIVSIVYLYHLSIFRAVETLPDGMKQHWKQLLFVGHLCMSSFIVTAICTRFVFSSVSLEGKAYWLLQASPVESRHLLNFKFYFWFVPAA
ncbi:MAG: hypothetical protein KDD62_13125 [Bdellovibrionales bacterium]|nr:hypothetical protein [Bdellovibrionales bacterium]